MPSCHAVLQAQVLAQILGCGLATGAASAWALKQATDDGALASPPAQRLQLGLMGFSLGERATRQPLFLYFSPEKAAPLPIAFPRRGRRRARV